MSLSFTLALFLLHVDWVDFCLVLDIIIVCVRPSSRLNDI